MRTLSKIEISLLVIVSLLIILRFIAIFSVMSYALLISMYALGILYFPFGFTTLKHSSGTVGWLNILVGLTLSMVCFGICFKVFVLDGANRMLLMGLPLLIIAVLLALVSTLLDKGRKDYYKLIFVRATAFIVVGIVLFFVPSTTLVKIYYRDDPERIKVTNSMITNPTEENRKAYFDYLDKISKK